VTFDELVREMVDADLAAVKFEQQRHGQPE